MRQDKLSPMHRVIKSKWHDAQGNRADHTTQAMLRAAEKETATGTEVGRKGTVQVWKTFSVERGQTCHVILNIAALNAGGWF